MKRGILVSGILFLAVACAGSAASSTAGSSARSGQQPVQQGAGSSQATAPAVISPAAEGPKVVRTGRVTIEIPNGQFEHKLSALQDLMTGLGGYAANSDAGTESGTLTSGSITFQVPSEQFQAALDGVRQLGKVQAYVVNSQDVSNQYVDLQARLANEEAVRDAILEFFKDAHSVQDDITIENQLGQVTGQIEQLKGQINYIDHATALASVTVTMREAAAAARNAGDEFGLGRSLNQAAHNFVYVVNGMLEVTGSLLPFALLLIPTWFALRYRRSLARILAL